MRSVATVITYEPRACSWSWCGRSFQCQWHGVDRAFVVLLAIVFRRSNPLFYVFSSTHVAVSHFLRFLWLGSECARPPPYVRAPKGHRTIAVVVDDGRQPTKQSLLRQPPWGARRVSSVRLPAAAAAAGAGGFASFEAQAGRPVRDYSLVIRTRADVVYRVKPSVLSLAQIWTDYSEHAATRAADGNFLLLVDGLVVRTRNVPRHVSAGGPPAVRSRRALARWRHAAGADSPHRLLLNVRRRSSRPRGDPAGAARGAERRSILVRAATDTSHVARRALTRAARPLVGAPSPLRGAGVGRDGDRHAERDARLHVVSRERRLGLRRVRACDGASIDRSRRTSLSPVPPLGAEIGSSDGTTEEHPGQDCYLPSALFRALGRSLVARLLRHVPASPGILTASRRTALGGKMRARHSPLTIGRRGDCVAGPRASWGGLWETRV